MAKNTGKVTEFRQSGKVGTLRVLDNYLGQVLGQP